MRLFIFIVTLLFCSSVTTSPLKISPLSSEHGLSGESVWSIAQDSNNFIWLGTNKALHIYDGYDIKLFKPLSKDSTILSLHHHNGTLWAGVHNKGLVKISTREYTIQKKLLSNIKKIRAITNIDNGLWVGSELGLHRITNDTVQEFLLETPILSLSPLDENRILVGTENGLFVFNLNRGKFHRIPVLTKSDTSIRVRAIQLDKRTIWLATNHGLYHANYKNLRFKKHGLLNSSNSIYSLASNKFGTWIGTYEDGIYLLNKNTLKNFKKNINNPLSIKSNTILSLAPANDGTLWYGGFSGGAGNIDYSTSLFGLQNQYSSRLSCLDSLFIYSLFEYNNKLLIGTNTGAFEIHNGKCFKLSNDLNIIHNFRPLSFIEKNDQVYFGSNQGIGRLNKKTKELEFFKSPGLPQTRYHDLGFINQDELLLTTSHGVFSYNISSDNVKKHPLPKLAQKAIFHKVIKYADNFYLASDQGLYFLAKNTQTIKQIDLSFLANQKVIDLHIDKNILWASAQGGKLIKITTGDHNNPVLFWELEQPVANEIQSINSKNNDLWLSTYNGIVRLNTTDKKFKLFTSADGTQKSAFTRDSSITAEDGRLYFGGRNGFNAFYPEDIKDNLVPPKVALTKLTRFNKEVVPDEDYEGFGIDKPIEYLEELEIGHRDYVIGFEFAGLHYADPMRNQYQFMLEGFHEDWVSTDAKNRNATFTNLSPGDYVFRVKAANKDGVWSLDEDNVALKITVHPAPWLSWWAFLIYGLMILGSILWFIRYRTKSAIARSKELEQEVSVRTKEIETQKNVIESLLERKNELFANISHEFRTPLTLILGPLEKELKALDSPKNPKHLQMIQRNATRLLGMVEQILKLTELKKEETVNKVPHAVNPALEAIVESFSSLAESKQIELTLDADKSANVMAANDALEVMVGNLVSNAIKYTPEGGKVSVTSKLLDNTIQIQVTDTGVGMTKAQKEDVFERFVRLDKTSDIAGTGIGLSIVKELILAHNGQVSVDSIEGQGSTFIITLPTTDQAALSDTLSIKSIEHLTQGETTASEVTQATEEALTDTQQELILIIDDNPDMRDYISEVLNPNYHCITADRGETGIELAKAQVPDLIICDIMMPGIDGYEVAKRLRDDIITSHIPLVLLTAKGDKESRIQGWNENIDDYMTKPFDEEELRARVTNIISLRNLVRNQFKKGTIAEPDENSTKQKTLNKLELTWINKINVALSNNYSDPNFTRIDLAALMALSERQFQRKLKAILNKTPTELIKEYRLKKSAELIKDGLQVSLAADQAGFNNLSHFSQAFKAYFGTSPSKYN